MSLLNKFISWIALLLSISAILLFILRCDPIEAEWMSILVGILSLLVTFLVGWQIYKTIEVSQFVANYSKIVDNKIEDVSRDFNHILSCFNFILESHNNIRCRVELNENMGNLMNALEEAYGIKSSTSKQITIEKILDEMEVLIKNADENEIMKLTKNELKRYKKLLRKTGIEKADLIEEKILDSINKKQL